VSRIIGFVAGLLLVVLLVMVWLPIPNETKLVSIIYLWVILAIFSGAVAVITLPRLLKWISGLMTVAIIVWSIAYLPQIIKSFIS
jgi:hypothetical protein